MNDKNIDTKEFIENMHDQFEKMNSLILSIQEMSEKFKNIELPELDLNAFESQLNYLASVNLQDKKMTPNNDLAKK